MARDRLVDLTRVRGALETPEVVPADRIVRVGQDGDLTVVVLDARGQEQRLQVREGLAEVRRRWASALDCPRCGYGTRSGHA
jgi:hypothetical protein